MMNTCKKRKSQQSQTELPSKNPHGNHQQEDRQCEGTSREQNPITIPYLPTPIVFEILSRVGIKTLFNCRLVCKSWADLISTHEFAQLHLSRSPTSCLIKPLNKEERQSKGLHLVDLECRLNLCNKLVFISKINLPNVHFRLFNSCNGLLCLCQLISPDSYTACNIYVCNPVLREYITLPKPPHIINFFIQVCAFGFCHKTNQYKVVLSSYTLSSGNCWTDIYTLGAGSWRSIENAPYPIVNCSSFNAFLNGAHHWIPLGLQYHFICCFDFESEQFREVPQPSEFGPPKNEFCTMQLDVMNGNLSICEFGWGVGDPIVIWVMKDYGVKESWSKDFVITHVINETHIDSYKPIMITSNGEILMILENEYIMRYDPKSETFESEMKIFGLHSGFRAIAHVPSLISLKDVAKGENLKVLGSN